MPKLVKDAIRGYQSEANSVNVFLNDDDLFERIEPTNYEECVKLDKNGMDVLYPKYAEMCKESNMKPLSKPKLKKQLQKNRAYKLRGIQYTIEYRQCLCGYKLKPSFTYTSIDGKTTVIQR
jgi:regulator of PEP synthase PpsR (kinase-PPPase family)